MVAEIGPDDLPPRWNIAPSQTQAVLRIDRESGALRIDALRWGLIPHWAKDRAIANRTINARSEECADKPAFRDPYRKKRGVVIVDGYYEWKRLDAAPKGPKQPYLLHMPNGEPFALAGLWDQWTEPATGEVLETCTILTRAAEGAVAELHDRMPVILSPTEVTAWIDPRIKDDATLTALVASKAWQPIVATPVSTAVNDPKHEGPDCSERATVQGPAQQALFR
jgi:putative SOS response-associated peptidase YedK